MVQFFCSESHHKSDANLLWFCSEVCMLNMQILLQSHGWFNPYTSTEGNLYNEHVAGLKTCSMLIFLAECFSFVCGWHFQNRIHILKWMCGVCRKYIMSEHTLTYWSCYTRDVWGGRWLVRHNHRPRPSHLTAARTGHCISLAWLHVPDIESQCITGIYEVNLKIWPNLDEAWLLQNWQMVCLYIHCAILTALPPLGHS